ncbi:hypothetical protein BGW41_005362 [Actinomortierella wolfii]|nr:hypothetical protein BGW41_005362 [Actinomortierella wolfii]
MVRALLGLAACAALALADVSFNVIGLRDNEGDSYGVLINGKTHKLTTTKNTYPVWSANVAGVDAPLAYKYVHLDKAGKVIGQDKAIRKLPAGATQTPNEYFGRKASIYNIPELPQAFENHLEQNSPFFRDGYIGNLFIQGNEADWKKLNVAGSDSFPDAIKVRVQYVGANENVIVQNVAMKLSGASAREYSKLAYQFKFPKNDTLLDLSTLKLRNAETDPTMLREKLYVDILNSIGVPAQQASYLRLFFNGRPVGLFVAMEEMKKHWVRKVLHPDVPNVEIGSLWKMNSCCGHEGNLEWLGPTTKSYVIGDIYKPVVKGKNVPKDDIMQDLIQFMKDLKDYNPKTNKDPIGFWEKRLDLDGFLKSMAMEYLAGAWDAYWQAGSNYQFYHDPVTNKWIWLPTDFDDTFGTSFEGKIESYRNIPKVNENGFSSPLAQKLIMETPVINKRFEEIVKTIVSVVFKPQALNPRVDAYVNMIEEDIAWDRKLPRVAKGKTNHFTLKDLRLGLTEGVESEWGLKQWIEERVKEVQKGLKFKAPTVVSNRVTAHNMHPKLMSVYGLKVASVDHKNVNATTTTSSPADKDKTPQKPIVVKDSAGGTNTQKPKTAEKPVADHGAVSSANMIRGQWAALSAMVAMVVLTL